MCLDITTCLDNVCFYRKCLDNIDLFGQSLYASRQCLNVPKIFTNMFICLDIVYIWLHIWTMSFGHAMLLATVPASHDTDSIVNGNMFCYVKMICNMAVW